VSLLQGQWLLSDWVVPKNGRGIFVFFYLNKQLGKNMKKTFLASSMAILTMTAINAMGADCPNGYTETDVQGEIFTQSISQIDQFGSINMTLTNTNKKGKVLFSESGTLEGLITDQLVVGGVPVSTTLSHSIIFNDGSTIETEGDEARIVGGDGFCTVFVEEVISNVWGTQTFKRVTGEIVATGSLNVCTYTNEFTLSGTVCLFKGRK
jgi:hypothetical protein